MNTPLDYFGLRPDAGEREVKRAYASMLKSVRPDQDPAGFQKLHAMYQQALAWVRRLAQSTPPAHAETIAAAEHPKAAPPELKATAAPAEASPEPFHPAQFLQELLPRLGANDAPGLLDWLHQQPMLWSLEHKRAAGQIALNRLFQDLPPVAGATSDALLQFFGLDQIGSGADPIRLRWLRGEMDEQYWALQRARGNAVLGNPWYASPDGRLGSPWGEHEAQFDPERFLDWFCAKAPAIKHEDLIMYVRVGLMPLTGAAKGDFARRVIERLWREAPPLPASCSNFLLKLLLPYAGRAGGQPALRDLATRLQVKWLTRPENGVALHLHTRPERGERRQATTQRLLRCAMRPFAWWRVLLACLLPLWPTMMGTFLRKLGAGQPARLHEILDPRTVDFWIAASDRQRLAPQRLAVGAIRCAVLLLCSVAIALLRKAIPDSTLSGTDPWDLFLLALIATGVWLAYLVFMGAYFWQRAPEAPARPYALIRFLFIPLMLAPGLAIYFGSDNMIAAQVILTPLAALAFLRCQARNGIPIRLHKLVRGLRVLWFYLAIGLLTQALRVPLLSAGTALALWIADASRRENRPVLKRERNSQVRQPSRSR